MHEPGFLEKKEKKQGLTLGRGLYFTHRFTTVVYGVRASVHKPLATARRPGGRSAIWLLAVYWVPASGSDRTATGSRSFPYGDEGHYTRTISGYGWTLLK